MTGADGSGFDQLSGPNGLAVDAADRLYIADAWNNRVQVFDKNGAYLTTIAGSWGTRTSQTRSAEGVAVAPNGDMFVADWGNHRIQKFAAGVPGWRQVNINGFGERGSTGSGPIAAFAGSLYHGSGPQLWRMDTGGAWTLVRDDGFSDKNNWFDHLFEFQGKLYAGLGHWVCDDPDCNTGHSNGGEVWRSSDGTTWNQVVSGGFGDTANAEVQVFTAFADQLYAGTWSGTSTQGLEIWRSATGDQGTWSQVVSNGFNDAGNQTVLAFAVHNGYLYAGTRTRPPAASSGARQTGPIGHRSTPMALVMSRPSKLPRSAPLAAPCTPARTTARPAPRFGGATCATAAIGVA